MQELTRRRFAVTTPGLTATRWLSQVLAAHPDVFVAHGKFALESVADTAFDVERLRASRQSLTHGNHMRSFYENRSLEEVFAAYQDAKPAAWAHGCVHSYTMHTLVQAARNATTLNRLNIANVVRHPVSFIASHEALVRSAEQHPPLYQHYLDDVFPQVLQQFPELYLLGCPDLRAFVAFAISCRAVNTLLLDGSYPGIRHVQMEALTTQVEVLKQFCEGLTEAEYPLAQLADFIERGAINQHRAGKATRNPHQIYASWEPWQQDIAHVMLSPTVLDWLAGLGYDLAMLNVRLAQKPKQLPCLVDCLRTLDQHHPLLAYLTPSGTCRLQVIENEYQGFQLAQVAGRIFATARSLENIDVAQLDEAMLGDLQEEGMCLGGASLGDLWREIACVLDGSPQLVDKDYLGFNIVTFRGRCYAVKCGNALNLERLRLRAASAGGREQSFPWAKPRRSQGPGRCMGTETKITP